MTKQKMKRADLGMKTALAIASLAGAVYAGIAPATAAEPFALTSAMFRDGGTMPKKVGGNRPGAANCVGDNVSPQLSWSSPPAETKSFVVTIVDPEGGGGLGVVHLVAYGIAPDISSFAEDEITKPSRKFVGGKGTRGFDVYVGPCPSPGTPHHYTFVVTSTDLAPDALPAGLTLPQLQEKLTGHAKGAAGLVGLYGNPWDAKGP